MPRPQTPPSLLFLSCPLRSADGPEDPRVRQRQTPGPPQPCGCCSHVALPPNHRCRLPTGGSSADCRAQAATKTWAHGRLPGEHPHPQTHLGATRAALLDLGLSCIHSLTTGLLSVLAGVCTHTLVLVFHTHTRPIPQAH